MGEILISASLKDLKDSLHYISPLQLPFWPLQKLVGSWRITVVYHKLNQIVALISVTETEQI